MPAFCLSPPAWSWSCSDRCSCLASSIASNSPGRPGCGRTPTSRPSAPQRLPRQSQLEAAPATVPSRRPRMLAVEDVLPAPSAGVLPPPEPSGPSPASPDLAASRDRTITGSVRLPSTPPASTPPRRRGHQTRRRQDAGRDRAAACAPLPPRAIRPPNSRSRSRYAEGRGVPQNLDGSGGMVRARRQAGPRAGPVPPRRPLRKGHGRQEGPRNGAPPLSRGRRRRQCQSHAQSRGALCRGRRRQARLSDRPPIGSARPPTTASTDSQYNLGILYARGIGVEANLAEAYKWFALAAREGDTEAAKKRDDVGARLDQAIAGGSACRRAGVGCRSRSPRPRPRSRRQPAAGTARRRPLPPSAASRCQGRTDRTRHRTWHRTWRQTSRRNLAHKKSGRRVAYGRQHR